jgi:hypothetical protein
MTWTFGPAELKKNSTFTFMSNNILDLDKFLCGAEIHISTTFTKKKIFIEINMHLF